MVIALCFFILQIKAKCVEVLSITYTSLGVVLYDKIFVKMMVIFTCDHLWLSSLINRITRLWRADLVNIILHYSRGLRHLCGSLSPL